MIITNLFATVGKGNNVRIRRVPLSRATQESVHAEFTNLATRFTGDRDTEVKFDGGYYPEEDEILYLDDLIEAKAMCEAADGNVTALERLDESELDSGEVKALFVATHQDGGTLLHVQAFQRNQVLSKKRTLLLSGDTYNNMEETGLLISNSLVAKVDGSRTSFISFAMAKRVFDLDSAFQSATDEDMESFADHPKLSFDSREDFVSLSDQIVRKKVPSIRRSGILDDYSASQISAAAEELDIELPVRGDQIVIPSEKRAVKDLLKFLDDGIYKSGLTGILYVTSSKRPVLPK